MPSLNGLSSHLNIFFAILNVCTNDSKFSLILDKF
jgi:hypothetical protein